MKNVSDDQLANAIRTAQNGQRVLSTEAIQALINLATHPSKPVHQLTSREIEVLGFMIEGLNNLDIVERLYLSRSTIKYHVSKIFTKLGVNNRAEAISFTIKNDLI